MFDKKELLITRGIRSPRDTVMFTIATGGYVPFVLNLHASLKRIGMGDQLVVYSLDDAAQRELSGEGIHCSRYAADIDQQWNDYRTPGFTRTVAFKYAVALDILKTEKNALYVDSDVVFLRNPATYLDSVIAQSSAHLVMQFESPKNDFNTGFWLATPTRPVLDLFSRVWSALQSTHFRCDQHVLNEYLPQVQGLTTCALDPDLFACGNRFLGSATTRAKYSKGPFEAESAYILHFNYLVGKEAKALAMMKHNALFHPELAKYSRRRKMLAVPTRLIRASSRRARVLRTTLTGQRVSKWPKLVIELLRKKGKVVP